MSIDDIIKHINEDYMLSYRGEADYARVELQYIPKIVALLKAGQAIRDNYYTAKTAPGDNLDCDNAIGDWDEATKENV